MNVDNPLIKDKTLREKLTDKYRLVILNDETMEEVSSYYLSLQNIYVLISSFIVILGLLIILFIFYTPVKKLIPGYGEVESNPKFIELTKDLAQIEETLLSQQIYLEGFKKMLIADEMERSSAIPDDERLKVAINKALSSNASLSESPAQTNLGKNNSLPLSSMNQLYLTAPVTGVVSAAFDPKIKHLGVDIVAKKNTPVKSMMDGFVIMSDWNIDTGHTIGIQHPNNMVSFYKHNSVIMKEEGDFVRAGEAIAIVGNTGKLTDGPHLHFELWLSGNPVNPEDYLKF